MRVRVAAAITTTAVSLLLTGCDDTTDRTDPGPRGSGAAGTTASPAPGAGPAESPARDRSGTPSKSGPETVRLPSFVGMGLQSAQDTAQGLGFHDLTSHDALGRGRNQFLDRNWKVCFQTPRPGSRATDSPIDFGTVKLDESCPAKDAGTGPAQSDGTVPDFTGKSVKVARQALDGSTSLTVTDASAEDRIILVESNWRVCTQRPAAGSALNGRPVALTAVKFGETCP
ncbi:hypothetical protein [Streptomyces pactum]|uniref:hypothetical protein n=1 Tax=Streptomyces pactum TaxID=68249 RepID=UPI0036FA8E61